MSEERYEEVEKQQVLLPRRWLVITRGSPIRKPDPLKVPRLTIGWDGAQASRADPMTVWAWRSCLGHRLIRDAS